MGIKFANGGFITTIQDMGRTGYQEFGVPAAGVMTLCPSERLIFWLEMMRMRLPWR